MPAAPPPYCPTIDVDLSRFDLSLTLETAPDIDVEVVQSNLVIEAVTLANQGPKGDPGPVGPPGADSTVPGPKGDPGVQGVPGAKGDPGTGLSIKGTIPTAADLPATGQDGDVWITDDTGHGWGWSADTNAWIDLGPMQGPPGASGPAGPAGVDGVSGPKGDQGDPGPTGPQGVQGPIGLTGSTGAQGPPGSTGAQGPAGATGAQGAQGIQGNPGPTGSTGATGSQGPIGNTGPQGPQGNTGATGAQGPPGPTAVSTDAGNIATLGSDSKILVPQSTIWSARLRTFNAIGNPNFEVDQRNVGNAIIASGFIQDRWQLFKAGTMAVSVGRQTGSVMLPGTSFVISQNFLRVTLTTAQATLGATDQVLVYETLEGPQLRELIGDVHSISLLVRSTVSNLKFGLSLRDSNITHSLVKLCTLGAANTWSLIPLPNILIFVSGGSFPLIPGGIGYQTLITLACGTGSTVPANDTWQNGNFVGAVGQDNFAAQAVNSTFDIAFVQHEPGPLCTTLIDKPFSQNLDEALRYYQKTYLYGTAPGAVSTAGIKGLIAPAVIAAGYGPVTFFKPMARAPTVTIYNHATGAANSIQDGAGVNHASAAALVPADSGFYGVSFTTAVTSPLPIYCHYTADTQW